MQKSTELELIDELLELHERRSPYLDADWQRPSPERYLSSDIFQRENARIFHRLPHIVAHVSELPDAGDFITRDSMGRPLLLTRGDDGAARAFYNVCRHRGARLERDGAGCRRRFSCPYHAWTYNNAGELVAVPHEKSGFPGLEREEFGLRRVACEEYAGWIWIAFDDANDIDVAAHLGEMAGDMLAMRAADYVIVETTGRDTAANWKILVEGGIESYHFRVAHRNTIAPLFLDNLSTYRRFGPHMRSVLPRSTLPEMKAQAADERELGKHANVLYTTFPGSQFLMQEDHFVWIRAMPVAPDRTVLTMCTLVPAGDNTQGKRDYWARHHAFTMKTLEEDFVLGEEIQQGLACGANTHLNFGRFEGALSSFNAMVEDMIG